MYLVRMTPRHDDGAAHHAAHTTQDATRTPSARSSIVPWIISLTIHGVILLLGFLIVWSADVPPREKRLAVTVNFDDPGALASPEPPAPPSPRAPGAGEAPSPRAQALQTDLNLPQSTGGIEFVMPDRAPIVPDAEAPARTIDQNPSMLERSVPEVRFVGLGVTNASDIVYIVDASGSMVGALPVVLEHLQRSITRLARHQRFQVIFFGREEYESAPHPGDVREGVPTTRLIRATPENVREVLAWTNTVLPGGRSDPVPALRRALWLRPDAVFLLSNVITGVGQWEADKDSILREVDRMNPVDAKLGRRRTVIKALQFLEEDPAEILKTIGTTHGGDDGYRFIPRKELSAP